MLENKAFLLNSPKNTTFATRPIPEPGDDDVLVEVKKTGICGSDIHWYTDGKIFNNVVKQPFALGHESSGVVVKAGAGVKNVKVGDRVALEPAARCRICGDCKSGNYQLCARTIMGSSHPVDGMLQRYYMTPADFVYKLPDHLTLEDGAMVGGASTCWVAYFESSRTLKTRTRYLIQVEPLSVAVHAVSFQGKLQLGENVVVFGAGPIGLLCMAVARAIGAARIIAVDIKASRLKLAQEYAATEMFLSPEMQPGESKFDYATRTAEIMKDTFRIEDRGPNSIDVIFDATGAETCVQTGLLIARFGGRFIAVGIGASTIPIPMIALLERELTIKGANTYGPGDYPLAIQLVSSSRVDLKPLVTHRFKFEDAPTAFQTVRDRKGISETGQTKDAIKVIISGPDVDVASI